MDYERFITELEIKVFLFWVNRRRLSRYRVLS